MEVIGKIIEITPIQEGTSRTGNPWKKRMYVIETQENYPRKVAFTVFGADRVANMEATVRLGDMVRVSFDLESREYQGRWYTDASAWRIDQADAGAQQAARQPAPAAYQTPAAAPVPPAPAANSEDDLPF